MITLVTTHPTPDLDACTAAAALWWCYAPHRTPVVRFAAPAPGDHCPAAGRFVVDTGRGELDHHQLPDPRAACAFGLTLAYIQRTAPPPAATRAMFLTPLLPLVLAQDSTGRMFADPEAQAQSLGAILNRIVWACQNDHAAWAHAWVILDAVFTSVAAGGDPQQAVRQPWITRWLRQAGHRATVDLIERTAAQDAAAWALVTAHPEQVCARYRVRVSGPLARYDTSLIAGTFAPGRHLRSAIAAVHPTVQIIVSRTRWRMRAGGLISDSRGFGRTAAGAHLDCRDLLAQARTALPAFDQELASWYAESWFAGTGSLKVPRPDPPPAGLLDALATALAARIAGCHEPHDAGGMP